MRRLLLGATAAGCLAAVGAAVYTQHAWNMLPCPWCVLQRLILVAMAVTASAGLVLPRRGSAAAVLLTALLAACGLGAALWQHFVAASSASCDLTLADRLMAATGLDERFPNVFMAMASCADAQVQLAGLPYEAWSGGLFLLVGLSMAWVAGRRP